MNFWNNDSISPICNLPDLLSETPKIFGNRQHFLYMFITLLSVVCKVSQVLDGILKYSDSELDTTYTGNSESLLTISCIRSQPL